MDEETKQGSTDQCKHLLTVCVAARAPVNLNITKHYKLHLRTSASCAAQCVVIPVDYITFFP